MIGWVKPEIADFNTELLKNFTATRPGEALIGTGLTDMDHEWISSSPDIAVVLSGRSHRRTETGRTRRWIRAYE